MCYISHPALENSTNLVVLLLMHNEEMHVCLHANAIFLMEMY